MTVENNSEARSKLDLRLASGEITETEYDSILARLSGSKQRSDQDRTTKSEYEQKSDTTKGKSSYFARLWRGEIRLIITYWAWGGLASVIFALITSAFISSATEPYQIVIPDILLLSWVLFISISIIRSGGAYRKMHPNTGWGRIAQVMACISILTGIGNFVRVLPKMQEPTELDEYVKLSNKDATKMISEHTRFDSAERHNRDLIYNFTILGETKEMTPELLNQIRDESIKEACSDKDVKKILLAFDKVTYNYFKESKSPLYSVDITRSGCN